MAEKVCSLQCDAQGCLRLRTYKKLQPHGDALPCQEVCHCYDLDQSCCRVVFLRTLYWVKNPGALTKINTIFLSFTKEDKREKVINRQRANERTKRLELVISELKISSC